MVERRPDPEEKAPVTPPPADPGSAYTDEEEAEVQKRLEDLGYVE